MPDPAIGLCFNCLHSRIVPGERSTFYMCRLSFTDPAFPKYPRLPVIACAGYAPPGQKNPDKLGK
jgi:hypothetical protein